MTLMEAETLFLSLEYLHRLPREVGPTGLSGDDAVDLAVYHLMKIEIAEKNKPKPPQTRHRRRKQ